jgi:FAD/FMN-containing dehydrogenase
VSNTGIGGLTLGGGLGWLMGKHGLTIDNLISAEVVTADGQVRKASAAEHPDLFWALRGGGGNFGVVTAFEYRLHPVTQVLGGMVLYPLDQAAEVLRFYRDFCPTLPDEAEAYAALLTTPEGMPAAALLLGYNGPIEEGEKVLAPARRFGKPLADLVAPMLYGVRQSMLDAPNAEHRLHRYWRAGFTEQISDALIGELIATAAKFSSPLSAMIFVNPGPWRNTHRPSGPASLGKRAAVCRGAGPVRCWCHRRCLGRSRYHWAGSHCRHLARLEADGRDQD